MLQNPLAANLIPMNTPHGHYKKIVHFKGLSTFYYKDTGSNIYKSLLSEEYFAV